MSEKEETLTQELIAIPGDINDDIHQLAKLWDTEFDQLVIEILQMFIQSVDNYIENRDMERNNNVK